MAAYVYILASKKRGTLYIGVTKNVARRAFEHRTGIVEGFTKSHSVRRLVYIEPYEDIRDAIAREKQLKNWQRDWKINLIEDSNPEWRDLFRDLNR